MFDPPSGTPGYSSKLTITATTGLPIGTYPLTIKALSGDKERYATITLKVEKGPDYTLSLSPDSEQVKAGESAVHS